MTVLEGVESPVAKPEASIETEPDNDTDGAQVELSTSGPAPPPIDTMAPPERVNNIWGQVPLPSNVSGAIGNGSMASPALAEFHARGTADSMYVAPVWSSVTARSTLETPAAGIQFVPTMQEIVDAHEINVDWFDGTLSDRRSLLTGVVVTPPVQSFRKRE